jgi:hypothetical protein
MAKISTFDRAGAAQGTLLNGFRLSLGTSASERLAHLTESAGNILALHLCAQPPRGMGAASDYRLIAQTLGDTGRLAWAQYAGALSPKTIDKALTELALKGRSVADWQEACTVGREVVAMLCAGVREAQAAKAKKASKTKDENKTTVVADVPSVTADGIIALIGAGQFSADDLARIMAACASASASASAKDETATA